MPRPQFTLKALLWLMALVAAFCGGMTTNQWLIDRETARELEEVQALRQLVRQGAHQVDLMSEDEIAAAKRKLKHLRLPITD